MHMTQVESGKCESNSLKAKSAFAEVSYIMFLSKRQCGVLSLYLLMLMYIGNVYHFRINICTCFKNTCHARILHIDRCTEKKEAF